MNKKKQQNITKAILIVFGIIFLFITTIIILATLFIFIEIPELTDILLLRG